jgi:ketosteroid isomerase-like protein
MSYSRLSAVFALVMILIAIGCRTPAPTGLSDADKAAIQKVLDEAVRIGNAPTKDWAAYVRAYYAEDAVVLPPNGPAVQGWALMESWFAAFPPMSDFGPQIIEVEGRGDLAFVRGTYSMMLTLPGAAEPTNDTGKYIEIWRKQTDGSWRVVRDMFNSDLPLAAPEATPEEIK